MKHLGDITKINGADIEPVWCITGGSPCQDLSVAGKRAGLAGERSGLFMEQMRIVKEMRERDKQCGRTGEYVRPRYMVWENVPGAFSSSGGKDFQAVLEEIIRVAEPDLVMPEPPTDRGAESSGKNQDILSGIAGLSLGELTMLNIGECPSVGVESRLSWILEDRAPEKYYLSAKACQGILNRASRRGKKLPEILQMALESMIAWQSNPV